MVDRPATASVWDYPRPPRLEPVDLVVAVDLGGHRLISTTSSMRVLETSHPPVYYLPPGDFAGGSLRRVPSRSSWCEFKGRATYWDVIVDGVVFDAVGWSYESPTTGFAALTGLVALYPSRMDACFVDGERVVAQEGDFYGGWITSWITGPFKGGVGTLGW